ncbi:MAG: hypothetical protein HY547_08400 [Elusimicrobia bacterium]|nr:hypothetical protein [Elusimicrobiota bacterium]
MERPKFIVDTMLGRLCQWLRLAGYDAAFVMAHERRGMLERSFLEKRAILTRETKLEKAHSYKILILRQQHYWDQIPYVWKNFSLPAVNTDDLFSRCVICNTPVEIVSKIALKPDEVPPKVYAHQNEFSRCPRCRKIYWRGSHVTNTINKLKIMGLPMNAGSEE